MQKKTKLAPISYSIVSYRENESFFDKNKTFLLVVVPSLLISLAFFASYIFQ